MARGRIRGYVRRGRGRGRRGRRGRGRGFSKRKQSSNPRRRVIKKEDESEVQSGESSGDDSEGREDESEEPNLAAVSDGVSLEGQGRTSRRRNNNRRKLNDASSDVELRS